MKTLGNIIGTRPRYTPALVATMPKVSTSDAAGRKPSLMDSSRTAQCRTCQDVGFYRVPDLPIADPRFGRAIPCQDCNGGRGLAPIADLLKSARVPAEKHALTLPRWRQAFLERSDYAAAFERFASSGQSRDGRRGLYLHGGTGNGKTGAAVGILENMLPRANGPARFLVWSDFLDSIRQSWNTSIQLTVAEAVADVNRAVILVVDEFGGSGRGSGDPTWRADVARRLTDARHDGAASGKVTIYTSQLDLGAVAREFGGEPIGAAIVSRLMGHCTVVNLTGHDARADVPPRRADSEAF